MSKPVYYYFNVRALGEAPRMLMVYGNYPFEDRRLTQEEFLEYKPKTPYGQVPVLEVNGKQVAQSTALARYFGRKFHLAGNGDDDELEIDAVIEFLADIRAKAGSVQYETNEAVKEEKHLHNSKNVYPELLQKLANIIEKNNGHLALGKLTWADFVFTGQIAYLKMMLRMPDLETKYPVFKKVVQTVESIPSVKKYIQNRPGKLGAESLETEYDEKIWRRPLPQTVVLTYK